MQNERRILSLDGGGSRGLFSLQILRKIDESLPVNPETGQKHTLNSYFDLMAGTSTGAILATLLRWGYSVGQIEEFYLEKLPRIFAGRFRIPGLNDVFHPDGLKKELQNIFGVPPGFTKEGEERVYWKPGDPHHESTMGSSRLQGHLMVVTLRADTLSPWIQTNHPKAPYNDPARHDCNLQIPLWQLIRASTAAPYYFPPQRVWFPNRDGLPREGAGKKQVWGRYFYFVDGGISGYNNPAHLAYRMATLPEYHFDWESGIGKLRVISIGTGDYDSNTIRPRPDRVWRIAAKDGAEESLVSLMALSSVEQDMQCRMVGKTLEGHKIDRGVGNLTDPDPRKDRFVYCRYQKQFSADEIEMVKKKKIETRFVAVDKTSLDYFTEEGKRYAEEFVKPGHFTEV